MTYTPIAKGEKKFAEVQPTEFTKDPAGNGPDLFSGAKTKVVDRKSTRLGKGPKQDMEKEQVAAESEQIDEGNKINKEKKGEFHRSLGSKIMKGVETNYTSDKEVNDSIRNNWHKKVGRTLTRNWPTNSGRTVGWKEVANHKESIKEEDMTDHSDLIDLILNKNPIEFEEAYFEKLAERVTVLTEEFEKSIGATIFESDVEVKTEEPVTEEYNEEEMFKLDESLDLTEANNVQTLRIKHSFHRGEAQKFSNEAIDLSSKAFRHGRSTEIGKHLTSTANELGKKADRHGEAAETAKQMLKKQGIDIWESVDDIDEESKAELAALAAAAMAKYKKPIHKVETGVTSGISGKEWKDAATGRTGKVEVTHREKKEKDELNPSATFKGTYAGAKFKGNVKH